MVWRVVVIRFSLSLVLALRSRLGRRAVVAALHLGTAASALPQLGVAMEAARFAPWSPGPGRLLVPGFGSGL